MDLITQVFPGIAGDEVAEIVATAYMDNAEVTKGIALAYGLTYPRMISELKYIAEGGLMSRHPTTWEVGTKVAEYFAPIFKVAYPVCADSILHNYSKCLI